MVVLKKHRVVGYKHIMRWRREPIPAVNVYLLTVLHNKPETVTRMSPAHGAKCVVSINSYLIPSSHRECRDVGLQLWKRSRPPVKPSFVVVSSARRIITNDDEGGPKAYDDPYYQRILPSDSCQRVARRTQRVATHSNYQRILHSDSCQRMVQRYRLNTQSLLSNLTCITIAYPHPYLPAKVIHATPPLPTHAIPVGDVTCVTIGIPPFASHELILSMTTNGWLLAWRTRCQYA